MAISVFIKEGLHDYLSQVHQAKHSEVKGALLLSKRHLWVSSLSPEGTNGQHLVWWGVSNMPFIYAHTSQHPVASCCLVAFQEEDFGGVAEWELVFCFCVTGLNSREAHCHSR